MIVMKETPTKTQLHHDIDSLQFGNASLHSENNALHSYNTQLKYDKMHYNFVTVSCKAHRNKTQRALDAEVKPYFTP